MLILISLAKGMGLMCLTNTSLVFSVYIYLQCMLVKEGLLSSLSQNY